jgi:hypothetical protein
VTVAGLESIGLGLERFSGVDTASGKNASSSSRSKLDESWLICCRMLGCRRRGLRVPKKEASLVGVGCAGRKILPGAFTVEDAVVVVVSGWVVDSGIAIDLLAIPLVKDGLRCLGGSGELIEESSLLRPSERRWASTSFVSLLKLLLLCALVGYAPGLSPTPTAPVA